MPKKQLIGFIVSTKMPQTAVVKVEKIKEHPKYKKRYKIHKKYQAHVKDGDYAVGDKVVIEECIPVSKHKKWQVVKKLTSQHDSESN